MAYMSRKGFHKILDLQNPVYTLAIVFGREKPWGYQVGNTIMESSYYRDWKHKNPNTPN